jgi:hypothetical protein
LNPSQAVVDFLLPPLEKMKEVIDVLRFQDDHHSDVRRRFEEENSRHAHKLTETLRVLQFEREENAKLKSQLMMQEKELLYFRERHGNSSSNSRTMSSSPNRASQLSPSVNINPSSRSIASSTFFRQHQQQQQQVYAPPSLTLSSSSSSTSGRRQQLPSTPRQAPPQQQPQQQLQTNRMTQMRSGLSSPGERISRQNQSDQLPPSLAPSFRPHQETSPAGNSIISQQQYHSEEQPQLQRLQVQNVRPPQQQQVIAAM